jgi:hypothetical protein
VFRIRDSAMANVRGRQERAARTALFPERIAMLQRTVLARH